jgi:hypothetical protein
MTHKGELEWVSARAPASLTAGTDGIFPIFFETEYQGRKLVLFRERAYRSMSGVEPNAVQRAAHAMGLVAELDSRWIVKDVLALADQDGNILYEFPPSRQVRDLMETVKYKASGVQDFLDEILNNNSEPFKA